MSSSSDELELRLRHPERGRPYIRRTTAGRVVYRRKRHLFNWRAAWRIAHDIPAFTPPPASGWAAPGLFNQWLTLMTVLSKCVQSFVQMGTDVMDMIDYLPGRGPFTRLMIYMLQLIQMPTPEGPPAIEPDEYVSLQEVTDAQVELATVLDPQSGGNYA